MPLSTGANEPCRPGKEEFLDEVDVLIDSKKVITNQKTTLQLAPPVISMETKLASTLQKKLHTVKGSAAVHDFIFTPIDL